MSNSQLEQIITEIEEYLDGCKFQPLSNQKIIVNKDELDELLAELRMKTPEEVKRYQKIISQKDAIFADAQAKSDEIIAQAQLKADQLVSEHSVTQAAYDKSREIVDIATQQAQDILNTATADANGIRAAAIAYTDDLLSNLESIVTGALQDVQTRSSGMIASLQDCKDLVVSNRNELAGTPSAVATPSVTRDGDDTGIDLI